ncbi:MAG: hypothetical protein O6942_03710 [Bacteroidetes bacterium]|nr:hypothetical protein [Bacteroidota bacterium]
MVLRLAIAAASDRRETSARSGVATHGSHCPNANAHLVQTRIERELPVFWADFVNDQLFLRQMACACVETLMSQNLKKTRIGNIVNVKRPEGNGVYIFCDYQWVRSGEGLEQIEPAHFRNGFDEFSAFLDDGLRRYRGVSNLRLPLYFKEFEFRYNHRGSDAYPILVEMLCEFVRSSDTF